MAKGQERYKKGMPMTELETLIKSTDFEWDNNDKPPIFLIDFKHRETEKTSFYTKKNIFL